VQVAGADAVVIVDDKAEPLVTMDAGRASSRFRV
jgi:hypothetical protein